MSEIDFLVEEIYKLQNKVRDDINMLHEDILDAMLREDHKNIEIFKELYKAERSYQDDLQEVITKFFAYRNERYKRYLNETFGYIDTDMEV